MHCSNLPFGAGPYVDECGELSSARPRQYDLEFGELPQALSRHRCSHRVASPITDIPGRDRRRLLVRLEGCYSRSSEKDSNPEQIAAQVIALALSFSELY